MNLWVSQVSAAGLILTDELVKLKGCDFGQHLGIPDDNVKFSNGWITNFKKQNSLRRYQLHGKASSVPLDSESNSKNSYPNINWRTSTMPMKLGCFIGCYHTKH